MKVLLENIKEIENEDILITIRLNSGQAITVDSKLYKDGDMKEFIGKEIDVLLSGFRSPITEYRIMPENNSPFELEGEYYKFDMIEELERKMQEKTKKRDTKLISLKKLGNSALIIEGTYIPKYFPDPKWNHRKLILFPDGGPAFDTEDGIFLLSPFHLKPKIPIEDFPKRFKMFLSLGLVDWTVEGHERKLLKRKPIYENTDKTFKIYIKNVKTISPSTFSGYIEIYLGEFCLIYEPFPVINVNALVKGISENIISESDNDGWEDDYIIVKGCGYLGCCAGLFWDLIHMGDEIHISNIRWTRGMGYPIEASVEGVYTIKLEDYRWEVLKLKEFCDMKSKNLDHY